MTSDTGSLISDDNLPVVVDPPQISVDVVNASSYFVKRVVFVVPRERGVCVRGGRG